MALVDEPFFVILNPAAGKGAAGRHAAELRHHLAAQQLPFQLAITNGPGDAERLACLAAQRAHRAVVAAGGDGTINEVVNGLFQAQQAGYIVPPLGLIPIGTGNDTAKMFGLASGQIAVAVARLGDGQPHAIDLGQVHERVFVNGLGIGFDAAVAYAANQPSRLNGLAVYVKALLTTLVRFRAPHLRVTCNGETHERAMMLATVGNGRCHGGGFWLTPAAQIDDGLFDVCLVQALRWHEWRHIPKVLRGKHTHLPQVSMLRTTMLHIASPDPLPVHLDGEILGMDIHDVQVSLLPKAIQIIG